MLWIIYGIMVLVTYVVLVINVHEWFIDPSVIHTLILACMAILWPFFWIRVIADNLKDMFQGGEGTEDE